MQVVLNSNPTAIEMEKAISAVFNRCCPADIRFHRNLHPSIQNWAERCRARVICLRWKNGVGQVVCEWPVGSKNLYNQGSLAFECLKIYAAASNSMKGELVHPDAWTQMRICMKHNDDGEEGGDKWVPLKEILPWAVRNRHKTAEAVKQWLQFHRESTRHPGNFKGLPVPWVDPEHKDIPPPLEDVPRKRVLPRKEQTESDSDSTLSKSPDVVPRKEQKTSVETDSDSPKSCTCGARSRR